VQACDKTLTSDMHRAQERRGGRADATAAAELVAPVRALLLAGVGAFGRMRHTRSLELYERALAVAEELPQPHDSLVVAFCMSRVVGARTDLREDVLAVAETPQRYERLRTAWRGDERALLLAQRCLALLHTRWRAGTLFTLRPEESEFLSIAPPPLLPCADDFIEHAQNAVWFWPPLRTPAEEEARTRGVHGALRTALEMDARPVLQLRAATMRSFRSTWLGLHDDSAAGGGILNQMQSLCGLSQGEVAALCALETRGGQDGNDTARRQARLLAAMRERGAADVARHGLRRCALPSCNSTEPHPKCYKLCGRCRGAAYCSAAHSKEDWKRHKREDGCVPQL
jgi:hypothetical protein